MGEFLKVCPKRVCISTVGTRTDLFRRNPNLVPITDFFGSVRKIEVSTVPVNVSWPSKHVTEAAEEETEAQPEKQQKPLFTYVDQLPIDTQLSNSYS